MAGIKWIGQFEGIMEFMKQQSVISINKNRDLHGQPRRRIDGIPRVLSILPDFPFPTNTGLHLRMVSNLELVRRLGCESRVLYFSTEERLQDISGAAQIANLCDGFNYAGPRRPQHQFTKLSLILHKLDFLMRGALSLPGNRYPFSMRYDAVGACKSIHVEAHRVKADFVVLPSFFVHYANSLAAQGYQIIADAIDVLSDLTASFLRKYTRDSPGKWLCLYANYLACQAQERIFLPSCSEIWATSSAEAESLSRIAPSTNIVVVPSSLDEKIVQASPIPSGDNVGFIGTYSSQPNLEAALFLAEQVFPILLHRRPSARLRLAGAGLSNKSYERLSRLAYVDILGAVPNSADFFNECTVVALPVFVRGGVPLKVIEAMARAKAIVASPELVNSLPVSNGTDLLVRSEVVAFAEAIFNLLVDREKSALIGRNARRTFLRHWSMARAVEIMRQQSLLIRP